MESLDEYLLRLIFRQLTVHGLDVMSHTCKKFSNIIAKMIEEDSKIVMLEDFINIANSSNLMDFVRYNCTRITDPVARIYLQHLIIASKRPELANIDTTEGIYQDFTYHSIDSITFIPPYFDDDVEMFGKLSHLYKMILNSDKPDCARIFAYMVGRLCASRAVSRENMNMLFVDVFASNKNPKFVGLPANVDREKMTFLVSREDREYYYAVYEREYGDLSSLESDIIARIFLGIPRVDDYDELTDLRAHESLISDDDAEVASP